MNEMENLYKDLKRRKRQYESELSEAQAHYTSIAGEKRSIIIKKIHGELYYYVQWRQGEKVKSRFLSAVAPGAIAKEERLQSEISAWDRKISELKLNLENVDRLITYLEKYRKKEKLVEKFSFEVYWKDEITARVYVREKDVIVSRFSGNPLKQLFASDKMTRYQLGQIFEMRCPERGRPDINELLSGMGLAEYNPYEIIKKTHGVSYNDYIWLRFPGEEITSKDVLVR